MIDLREIWLNKEFHYHRINSLILIILAILIFNITILLPWIREYYKSLPLEFFIISSSILIFVIHWQWYRSNFPKSKGKKKYLILAIATENLRQKSRIQKDLKDQIDSRIREFNLQELVRTKVLHNHLSESISNKMKKAREFGPLGPNNPAWNKTKWTLDKMNSQVLIYGELKERNSPDGAYYFQIEAAISHNPIQMPVSAALASIMKEVWKNEIKVLLNDEFEGFKATADHISFASTFLIALIAFANMQFDKCIAILDQLTSFSEKLNLKSYDQTIIRLKATSYHLGAILAHHLGDFEKSNKFQKEKEKLIPNPYNKFLSNALYQEKKGNSQLAMSLVDKSISYANGDGTWRYSKLYLNIRLKRFKEAISVIDKIEKTSFPDERTAVETVISYNRNALTEDSSHVQTYFIIGFLQFKKINNYPTAYESLSTFISLTKGNPDWTLLTEKANQYMSELNELMGLRKA